jgi:hypothetical protein
MDSNGFKGSEIAKRLEAISKDGVPGVGTARYFIVIAERKGFPPVEQIIELVHKNTNAPSAHEQPS